MPAPAAAKPARAPTTVPPHFLADLYTFDWSKLDVRLPCVSAAAVAVCLFVGILAGHPGGGLVAGGGALTIGFGANQRIADSRLLPMIAGIFATSTATFAGTVAGHRGVSLVVAAAGSAFVYGLLTARNTGISWVGQQASVALVVSSAFPMGMKDGLIRAGLVAAGGVVQTVFSSAGLRMMPQLKRDLLAIPKRVAEEAGIDTGEHRRELLRRLRGLTHGLPALSRVQALGYAVRLAITVSAAAEIYRRLGIQSGYWIPMTALLVQKPAFFETLTRALARVGGTVIGATLCSILIEHIAPRPVVLALWTTVFAMLSFATNPVNYGLFAGCLTAYIVFLLSLNQIPGPLVAERRAWCTLLGGVIALAVHVDALRRHRRQQRVTE